MVHVVHVVQEREALQEMVSNRGHSQTGGPWISSETEVLSSFKGVSLRPPMGEIGLRSILIHEHRLNQSNSEF